MASKLGEAAGRSKGNHGATGYSADLAYIHHTGFGGFAQQAAPGLLEILRQSGITGGLVVDLGCGSGIWARELCSRGYDVLGVDISASMIRLARQHAARAKFVVAPLLRFPLPRCAAITSMGECVNYCFDRTNSRRGLARFFRRVYDALHPGGAFVFDIVEPGQAPDGRQRRRHAQGDGWAVLVEAQEDPRRRVLTRNITSFRRVGKLYRRTVERHVVRLYDGRELLRQLRRAGFRARLLRGYGSFRLPPAHAVLLARKPEARRGAGLQPRRRQSS